MRRMVEEFLYQEILWNLVRKIRYSSCFDKFVLFALAHRQEAL